MPQTGSLNVVASLNYSEATGSSSEPWYMDTISCPLGTKRSNFRDKTVSASITDLRGREWIASLDTTGFQPVVSPSYVYPSILLSGSDDLIKKLYYPEVENILRRMSNADQIIFFDHTLRRHDPTCPETPLLREPVMRVHVDQNPKSAHDRVRNHVEEKYRDFKRFQIINVWRPIGNTVYDYPLAMADFRSLDLDKDLVPIELRYPPWLKDKETYGVKYNPMHKWYYWSHMDPGEVLLFKCYDSCSRKLAHAQTNSVKVNKDLLQEVAGLAPHTAFFHEEDAALNIRRQSIEVRAIVLHL